MIPVIRPIPAILLVAPLAAQSPMAASLVGQGQSGCLVYVGEPKGKLFEGLRELAGADELAELGIAFAHVKTTSQSFAGLAGELRLSPGSTWVLADAKGRCLLQGDALPSVEAVLNALLDAGAKSPIKALRDFLKQHPDHIEARAQLLDLLRKTAEARTLRALQVTAAPGAEIGNERDAEEWYRLWSKRANIDAGAMEGKKLNPEQDIKIWGAYAHELQAMFENGDWRRLESLPGTKEKTPAEVCSQMMVQIYGRHIPRIEAHLEEYPFRESLWRHYAWARAIAKQGSTRALLERLVPAPDTERFWPPEMAMGLLVAEERERGNWDFLAETLWAKWPEIRLFARNPAQRLQSPDIVPEAQKKGFSELLWRDALKPLLESLIKTNRTGDAETVILDMAKLPVFGDFRRMAAELAKTCGRGDLGNKWAAMKAPGKPSDLDMDDLEAELGAMSWIVPTIVLSGTWEPIFREDEPSFPQMDAMIRKGGLADWRLMIRPLSPRFSELMHAREGWPKGRTHWALLDTNRAVLASGPSFPKAEDIVQALERSKMEPPIKGLRRFASEHPGHMEAKDQLLMELKRLAELRAEEALERIPDDAKPEMTKGGALDKFADMLTEEEDHAIWGEYAALYGQTLPLSMECAQPFLSNSSFMDLLFFSSRTVRGVAHSLLPLIEAHLRRRPMDRFLWEQWVSLSDLGGQRHFRDLKNSLALSPLDDPMDFPPPEQRTFMMVRYTLNGNWQGIIDLHEWRWEAAMDAIGADPEKANPVHLFSTAWPLLAAYMNLGKDHEAEAIVEVFRRTPHWGYLKRDCADLARRYGRDALADGWAR